MKRLFFKISIFIFFAGLFSCTEDTTLDIAQAEMTQQFDVTGGIKYVTVKSNMEFTATSNASWCVPEIYPGGREYNLGIVVERNELADARTATVTVAAEGMSELLISVSQTGAGPIITVAETTVMVDEDNPEFTLTITANLPFVYELPDWIQPKAGNTPSIGTGLYDFTVLPLP
ncbi:MAG: BACON domain-containing protein, partial [Prevotellaceae bacterium]|nr:BACON domain-containing protein [Prevotellaceae bacterium]